MKHTAFRNLILFLAVSCLCSPAAADEQQPNADLIQPMLDRLAEMSFAEQQAWLRRLEERAARAARLTLPPERTRQQAEQFRSLLYREMISWDVLREAIRQTDSLERAAVERLAEQYQKNAAEKFKLRPDEAARRMEAWKTTHRNWKEAGGKFERQDRLIDWLELSIDSVAKAPREAVVEGPPPVVHRQPRPPKLTPQPIANPKPALHRAPIRCAAVQRTAEERRPERPPLELPTETQVDPPRPVETPPATISELPLGTVEVKADELAARIAGYNLALRALEAELDEEGRWDAARIEPLLKKLKILTVRCRDFDLFRELLPAEQRAEMKKPGSPQTAVSQLGARIFDARRAASADDFAGTEAQRRAELARLESLSRQLAETVGKEKKAGDN
ncbi:MAG: hypothetical protein JW959_14940 [Pirellulales bacterium]|nr:hypothetical protein [Pirellulales bacterium]